MPDNPVYHTSAVDGASSAGPCLLSALAGSIFFWVVTVLIYSFDHFFHADFIHSLLICVRGWRAAEGDGAATGGFRSCSGTIRPSENISPCYNRIILYDNRPCENLRLRELGVVRELWGLHNIENRDATFRRSQHWSLLSREPGMGGILKLWDRLGPREEGRTSSARHSRGVQIDLAIDARVQA